MRVLEAAGYQCLVFVFVMVVCAAFLKALMLTMGLWDRVRFWVRRG